MRRRGGVRNISNRGDMAKGWEVTRTHYDCDSGSVRLASWPQGWSLPYPAAHLPRSLIAAIWEVIDNLSLSRSSGDAPVSSTPRTPPGLGESLVEPSRPFESGS